MKPRHLYMQGVDHKQPLEVSPKYCSVVTTIENKATS